MKLVKEPMQAKPALDIALQLQSQPSREHLRLVFHERVVSHPQTYKIFHENVYWDAPPILLNGREKLRVVAYFAKRITKLDFTEHAVRVERSRDGGQQISTDLTFIITLLPDSLPLPKIKVNATVNLGMIDDLQTVSTKAFPCMCQQPCMYVSSTQGSDCRFTIALHLVVHTYVPIRPIHACIGLIAPGIHW